MQNKLQRALLLLLSFCLLLPALSGCNPTKPNDSTGTSTATQEPKETGLVTPPEVTVPDNKVEDSPDGRSKILYEVSGVGGSIDGNLEQTPGGSGTSEVQAIPEVGYRFKSWSDGKTELTRKGDTADKGKKLTIYAVFEPEYLEMPVINIATETGEDVDPYNGNQYYIGATMTITNCSAESALTDISMQMKGRGNFSWHDVEKKSYRLKLGESQKLLGLGEGKSKHWCLIANHCDQSLMRNYLSYQVSRRLSGLSWAPDCRNVEVYLNGNYRGVYLLVEAIRVNEHRVAVNEEVESGTDIGYLLQMTNNGDEEYHFRSNGFNFDIKNDLSTDPALADQQLNYIRDYVNRCWNAIEGGDPEEIEALLDVDSLVDSYLVEEFNKNLDVGYDSFYLSKDKGGKLTFGPIWDFDLAFGNSNEHHCEYADGLYTAVDYCNHYHSSEWYTLLMSSEWFRGKVAERWKSEEVQKAFGELSAMATAEAENNYKSYCRNFELWQIFGQCINRETYLITSLKNYTEHYQYLSKWIADRFEWLNGFIGGDEYNSGDLTAGVIDPPDPWNPVDPPVQTPAFSGGSGRKDDPYIIAGAEDFVALTGALGTNDFSGCYFLQIADLNMDGVNGYFGIGAPANFAGVYDGAGHTITAHIRSSDGCVFPYVSGLIVNLVTMGSVTNSAQAAGICRSVRRGGALINCASLMAVESTGSNAGGLSPSTQNGDDPIILNCFFGGTVKGAEQASPINCWLAGRGGQFDFLYYSQAIASDSLTTSDDDTMLTAAQMKNQLADTLNKNFDKLATALSKYGLTTSDLCSWVKGDSLPEHQSKVAPALPDPPLVGDAEVGSGIDAVGSMTNFITGKFDKLLEDQSVSEYFGGDWWGWGNWGGGRPGGNDSDTAESPQKLFDGSTDTKLCTDAIAPYDITWKMTESVTVKAYVLTTGSDSAAYPGRGPRGWTLSGSKDGKSWTALDSVANGVLPDRNSTAVVFTVDEAAQGEYSYYKLTINVGGDSGTLQLSELSIWG